jgi:aspartokinase
VALIVQKYGGTSVGSIEHIQAGAKKIKTSYVQNLDWLTKQEKISTLYIILL